MSYKWLMCFTALVVAKHITAKKAQDRSSVGPRVPPVANPIAKPSAKQKLKNFQDYVEQYQEMKKESQESFEALDEQVQDVKRLRRIIGDHDLELMAEGAEAGGLQKRRSSARLPSVAIKRRARSQARRTKLNAQGMSSHKMHTKHTMEYSEY